MKNARKPYIIISGKLLLRKNDGTICFVCYTGKVNDEVDNLLANKQHSDQGMVVGHKRAQASVSPLDQIKYGIAD